MSLRTHTTRRIGITLATGAAAVSALALAAPPANASTHWSSAGRGFTAAVAIQGAMDDARVMGAGEGQLSCELVGEPQVFEVFNDPNLGHVFYAQVTMACS